MQTLKTTCEGCSNWLAALPLGYKIYAAINYLMLVFVSGFPSLQQVLPNSAIAVIERLEFWRLFSSFLINGHFTAWNVILMNVCLWLLSLTMAHLVSRTLSQELKLSTVYILAQLIKQTVLINLVIDLTFYPIIYFNILGITYLQTGGIMIPTMFFLMQDVAKNPDELFKIFGMTCFLKKKYLAVIVMIAVLAINSGSIIIVLVLNCFIMGQYMCRKLPFFALPLSLYCAINRKIPDCLKNMSGFVDVEAVKDNLSEVCIDWCKKDLQQQPIIQEKRKAIKATIQ